MADWYILLTTGITLITFLTTGYFIKKNLYPDDDQTLTDINELIGRLGRVKEKICNRNNLGKVKIGSKTWKAQSQRGEDIQENEIVVVRSVENSTVFVEGKK